MELVAPWSAQHLFLLLHQFNDSDDNVLANARLEKDQSFFPASTNSYISAVSMRISLFGNNEGTGYAYKYLPPSWFISASMPDAGGRSAADLESERWVDSRLGAARWEFRSDEEHHLTLAPLYDLAGNSLAEKVELHSFTEMLCAELNHYRINRDSFLELPTTDGTFRIQLLDNPSKYLQGPGWGKNGLQTLRGRVTEVSDPQNIFRGSKEGIDNHLSYIRMGEGQFNEGFLSIPWLVVF